MKKLATFLHDENDKFLKQLFRYFQNQKLGPSQKFLKFIIDQSAIYR